MAGLAVCATNYTAVVATGPTTCQANSVTNCLYGTPGSLTLCTVCVPGYTVNNVGVCVTCNIGCLNSTLGAGTASTFPYLNYTGYCGISQTGSTAGTVSVCYKCAQGYALVQTDFANSLPNTGAGGVCIPLPANCLSGQAASAAATVATCQQCNPGYGLIWNPATNTQTCQSCNMTNCLTCDFSGVCTSCNTTTFLAPHQCFQCPYNCSACANATYCYNNCTKNYVYNSATG